MARKRFSKRQLSLFDTPRAISRAPVGEEVTRLRLSRQCLAILTRLQLGPATNVELSSIALKYTGRISDLRAAGYDIRCTAIDRVSGVSQYQLVQQGISQAVGEE